MTSHIPLLRGSNSSSEPEYEYQYLEAEEDGTGSLHPSTKTRRPPREVPFYRRHWPPWLVALALLATVGTCGVYILTTRSSTSRGRDGSVVDSEEGIEKTSESSTMPSTSSSSSSSSSSYLNALLSRQSKTFAEATARYTLHTGREPPPGFDKWFDHAKSNECLIDDYEQIHKDFEPFYQIASQDPGFFKRMLEKETNKIKAGSNYGMKTYGIENHALQQTTWWGTMYNEDWQRTLGSLVGSLPNMNLILNGRDEPRVAFNPRLPSRTSDALKAALNETDPSPYDFSPHPTAPWFEEHKCLVPANEQGFSGVANDDSAFLLYAASQQFTTDLYPLLSVAKVSPCFSDILIPPGYYYTSSGHYGHFSYPDNVKWEDKKNVMYWRGGGSGGRATSLNFKKFPRFHLVDISRQSNVSSLNILDVRMVYFIDVNCEPSMGCDRGAIEKEYVPFPERKDPRENVYQYKYLVDLDGNSFSGRYLGLLRSGSLVFKSTVFTEYVSQYLKPYEHYIPIKPDLSDLIPQIQWAIANDAEAKRIQMAGKEMADKLLTDKQHDCYFYRVLLEWARLESMGKK